jgi:hypothetical protein
MWTFIAVRFVTTAIGRTTNQHTPSTNLAMKRFAAITSAILTSATHIR